MSKLNSFENKQNEQLNIQKEQLLNLNPINKQSIQEQKQQKDELYSLKQHPIEQDNNEPPETQGIQQQNQKNQNKQEKFQAKQQKQNKQQDSRKNIITNIEKQNKMNEEQNKKEQKPNQQLIKNESIINKDENRLSISKYEEKTVNNKQSNSKQINEQSKNKKEAFPSNLKEKNAEQIIQNQKQASTSKTQQKRSAIATQTIISTSNKVLDYINTNQRSNEQKKQTQTLKPAHIKQSIPIEPQQKKIQSLPKQHQALIINPSIFQIKDEFIKRVNNRTNSLKKANNLERSKLEATRINFSLAQHQQQNPHKQSTQFKISFQLMESSMRDSSKSLVINLMLGNMKKMVQDQKVNRIKQKLKSKIDEIHNKNKNNQMFEWRFKQNKQKAQQNTSNLHQNQQNKQKQTIIKIQKSIQISINIINQQVIGQFDNLKQLFTNDQIDKSKDNKSKQEQQLNKQERRVQQEKQNDQNSQNKQKKQQKQQNNENNSNETQKNNQSYPIKFNNIAFTTSLSLSLPIINKFPIDSGFIKYLLSGFSLSLFSSQTEQNQQALQKSIYICHQLRSYIFNMIEPMNDMFPILKHLKGGNGNIKLKCIKSVDRFLQKLGLKELVEQETPDIQDLFKEIIQEYLLVGIWGNIAPKNQNSTNNSKNELSFIKDIICQFFKNADFQSLTLEFVVLNRLKIKLKLSSCISISEQWKHIYSQTKKI